MKKLFFKVSLILLLFVPTLASAHQPNQSFIYFRVYETAGIEGRFDIHINELNKLFGLNLKDYPGEEDVLPALSRIQDYLLKNMGNKVH